MTEENCDEHEDLETCPRCEFETCITGIVYCGTYLEENFKGEPGELNDAERRLLALAREWLADDTIDRCFEEG